LKPNDGHFEHLLQLLVCSIVANFMSKYSVVSATLSFSLQYVMIKFIRQMTAVEYKIYTN